MSYTWPGASTPSEEPLHGHDVVTPRAATEVVDTVTRVDDDQYILTLTLDGGGRLTMQGTRAELRGLFVRLMLTFADATDREFGS